MKRNHNPACQRRHPAVHSARRGAALVEFAIIAPVFLMLTLGTVEGGRALDVATSMNSAVREGGRLASMDWKGVVSGNMTANQKVISDIRNFLVASGLPGNDMTVSITHAEGPSEGQTFVLSDPENRNKLFKIQVAVPYSDVSNLPATFMKDQSLVASIVLRAGRVTLIN